MSFVRRGPGRPAHQCSVPCARFFPFLWPRWRFGALWRCGDLQPENAALTTGPECGQLWKFRWTTFRAYEELRWFPVDG